MYIGFGFAIITIMTPIMLLKIYILTKENKDYKRRLGK